MQKKVLSQDKLQERLHYNPDTGQLVWRDIVDNRGRPSLRSGRETALSFSPKGYARVNIYRKVYLAHRLIWFYVYGYFPENDIDHINKNKADNRIINLREVSRACNMRNTGNQQNNTSGIKGVYWRKREKKWFTYITVNRIQKSLGYYKDFDNAVCARLAGEQCLGWEDCSGSSPAFQYVRTNIINR